MYNYCKDSCNWCDSSENVGEFMNTWSLALWWKEHPRMKIIQCGQQTQTWAGWVPLGWSRWGKMAPQRNRSINLSAEFHRFRWCTMISDIWILDPDLLHIPKEPTLNVFNKFVEWVAWGRYCHQVLSVNLADMGKISPFQYQLNTRIRTKYFKVSIEYPLFYFLASSVLLRYYRHVTAPENIFVASLVRNLISY